MQAEMIVRICATCNKPLTFREDGTQEGYFCCDEYFHEGECLEQSFVGTGENWEHHYNVTEGLGGDCYFTEWDFETINETEKIV